jgi:protein-L-isoaspartate(D-aspartate) O-methyltransferase
MFDFAAARRMMVDGQVRTADVTEPRLLAAMFDTPRESFLPARKADLAYLDLDLPLGDGERGRRMLKPMTFAKLIQAAEIAPSDRVLDVGCGAGYSAAILAQISGSVVALEEDAGLARHAEEALKRAGRSNVTVVTGPLAAGAAGQGPYDVIVLEGATEASPATLLSQLAHGGRLVCVQGRGPAGKAMVYRKIEDDVSGRPVFDAAAHVLPGFAAPAAFVF